MVDRDLLLRRAHTAYERGRLWQATRVLPPIAALSLVAAIASGARELCLCIGVALAVGTVYARWANARRGAAAEAALAGGSAILLVALLGLRVAPLMGCGLSDASCAGLCAVVGLGAGAWLGARVAHAGGGPVEGFLAVALALLTAAMGCVSLGRGAMLGGGLAVILSSAVVFWLRRRRSRVA